MYTLMHNHMYTDVHLCTQTSMQIRICKMHMFKTYQTCTLTHIHIVTQINVHTCNGCAQMYVQA